MSFLQKTEKKIQLPNILFVMIRIFLLALIWELLCFVFSGGLARCCLPSHICQAQRLGLFWSLTSLSMSEEWCSRAWFCLVFGIPCNLGWSSIILEQKSMTSAIQTSKLSEIVGRIRQVLDILQPSNLRPLSTHAQEVSQPHLKGPHWKMNRTGRPRKSLGQLGMEMKLHRRREKWNNTRY